MKQKLLSKLTYCCINNNNYWAKTTLLLLWFTLFNAAQSQAQNPKLAWAKKMGGSNPDLSRSIAVDAAGNVYTTGYFSGTVDFDPNTGVSNLTSAGGNDIFVSKLDASGNLVWAKAMGGTGADQSYSIAVDAAGNVYTTGRFQGTADFDPNTGVSNLTSDVSPDIFVSKLDASGNFVWAKAMAGTGLGVGNGISVDAAGNVYTTGSFAATVDFDPNTGVSNLTSVGDSDVFVSKLDTSGNLVWAKAMGGTSVDQGTCISIDADGNVYTSGFFVGTADFDPNSGISNLTSTGGNDSFVSKLDASGNFVWAKAMGGFIGNENINDISVDAAGNVYTIGSFGGTADFDPNAGVSNLVSAGSIDIFVSKLDTSGNFVWAKAMGGTGTDVGYGISVDVTGNVYTTGSFSGTADFDPNTGVSNLVSAGSSDIFVSKLDTSGNLVWAKAMRGTGVDVGYGISVDVAGNVYTTGCFSGTADFDPNAGVSNLTSDGGIDGFTHKMTNQGAALHFNGVNDYVNCGNSPLLNITGALSLEAFINRTSLNTDDCIIGKDNYNANTGYSLWVYQNNKVVFRFGNIEYSSNSTIGQNTWTHVTGTYDAGTLKIYIDGVLDATYTGVAPPVTNTNGLYIGTPQDAVGNTAFAFSGKIDEVRIWNRVLAQAEIQNNRSCELTAGQTGLLAYYQFNQGISNSENSTITSLTDSSGNDNTGTLFNFALNGNSSNWIDIGGVETGIKCTAPLSIVASQTNVSCFGGTNGSATVVVSGGYSPYSYLWSPTGGTTATASGLTEGMYTCEVTDAGGNVLNQNFTITAPAALPDNTTTIAACATYTWANNNQTYTASGIYTGTTTNCVTEKLDLTITPITSNTTVVSAVEGYTWSVSGSTYTDSGLYSFVDNCNTEILDLTITRIDVTTTVNNQVITANQANATYQWYNCESSQLILNETSQSFTPLVSGNYSVQVFVNGYSKVSNCVSITTLGINTDDKISEIKLYPNPSTGIFNLEVPKDLQIEIYNDLGHKILSQKAITGNNTINISGKASGIYFLKAIEGTSVNTIKLIKK